MAVDVLNKVFPKNESQVSQKNQQQNKDPQKEPDKVETNIRLFHLKLNELLRFYWTNIGDQQRVGKIAQRLGEQRAELVTMLEVSEAGTISNEMIQSMIVTIDKVFKPTK